MITLAHPRPPRPLAATALLVVLAGCGGGGGGASDGGSAPTACGESARKQFVLDAAREWYLFDDLLPSTVDTAAFPTAEELLDHLTATARDQGKDRYFSYLTTRTEEASLLGEGEFVGFGFRNRIDPVDRPLVLEVFESSPAADAGMQRGDEIVAIDSGGGFVPVSQLLANGGSISDALGPADIGVQRGLRLLRDGVTREVSMVKRTVTIDPVPDGYGTQVLPQAGTAGVGYLNLRSYISTADPQLVDAFARFRALGLTDFIVDLRYNGGGLLSVAELLNNLLGGARAASDVQFRLIHNARKAAQEDETVLFSVGPESVQPLRIAFLTTAATASASEINVNSMAPWVEVAIVGEDTLGKPVGQYAFDLKGCEDRLRLVSFKTVNAAGQGDYYDGLASTLTACAAEDTVGQPLGSTSEGMVAAALAWLGAGTCTSMTSTVAARAKTSRFEADDPYRLPSTPTPAQWWLPGVN